MEENVLNDWLNEARKNGKEGVSKEWLDNYAKENKIKFPEGYLKLMECSNGISLYDGMVDIWSLPVEGFKCYSKWLSCEYMNSLEIKSTIPYSEGVFLFGKDQIGQYFGIDSSNLEDEIVVIDTEMVEKWYYKTFDEFAEAISETWL